MPEATVSQAEARDIAFRYLARREYACRELMLKLERKGVDSATASSVIADLSAEGLVSDTRFAEMFVRSRVSRLYGPLKIKAQLRQKGIDDGLIHSALGDYADNWRDMALSWVEKRAGRPFDRPEKARLYRSGTNRGFTHEQMMRALDRHQADS